MDLLTRTPKNIFRTNLSLPTDKTGMQGQKADSWWIYIQNCRSWPPGSKKTCISSQTLSVAQNINDCGLLSFLALGMHKTITLRMHLYPERVYMPIHTHHHYSTQCVVGNMSSGVGVDTQISLSPDRCIRKLSQTQTLEKHMEGKGDQLGAQFTKLKQ